MPHLGLLHNQLWATITVEVAHAQHAWCSARIVEGLLVRTIYAVWCTPIGQTQEHLCQIWLATNNLGLLATDVVFCTRLCALILVANGYPVDATTAILNFETQCHRLHILRHRATKEYGCICTESLAIVTHEEVSSGKLHIQYILRAHICTHLARRVGRHIIWVGTLVDWVGKVVLLAERCTTRVTCCPEHILHRREWIPARASLTRREQLLVVGELSPLLHIGVRHLIERSGFYNLYIRLLFVGVADNLVLSIWLQATNNSLHEALLVAIVWIFRVGSIPRLLNLQPLLRATLTICELDGCAIDCRSLNPNYICTRRDIIKVESHLGRNNHQLPNGRAIVSRNGDSLRLVGIVEISWHRGNLGIVVGRTRAKANIGGLDLCERVVLTTLYDGTMAFDIPLGSTNLTVYSPDAVNGLCCHNLPLVGLIVRERDILRLGHIHDAIVQILRNDNLRVVGLVAHIRNNICTE